MKGRIASVLGTALVAVVAGGCGHIGQAPAAWTFQPGFEPSADTRELRLDVTWIGCASGAAPHELEPEVSYLRDEVRLIVWAESPGGGSHTCQGNASVPLVVSLHEPVGERQVVQGADPH